MTLQSLFETIQQTADPAAGSASALLMQLIQRGQKGFRFRSLEAARCNDNVRLLLDLKIAVWDPPKDLGDGRIRLGSLIQKIITDTRGKEKET